MDGLPVTIRLLDPPLHEFLPPDEDDPRAHALREVNPMLGTRGCRLAILHPEIYEMQVRAIMRAQCAVTERLGHPPRLEVMVPLIDYERELEIIEELIFRVAARGGRRARALPRRHDDRAAAGVLPRRHDRRARRLLLLRHQRPHADGARLQPRRHRGQDPRAATSRCKVFDRSPFETLDTPGVGQLVRMGAWLGRKTKPELKLGVCGEHGGDPDSIDFFHNSGLDYVSCSPFRVPVARVAAAQAAIRRGDDGGW